MSNSSPLNTFKIPMLAKFLGWTEQNFHGVLTVGECYVITGYNPEDDVVEVSTSGSRLGYLVDANAFEVVRNNMWTFQHGHLAGMEGIIGDVAKFGSPSHDDHVETLSFGESMHIDLSNSPDYSATGRYIGNRWSELHEMSPARRLTADDYPELKLSQQQYDNLECRTAAFIHQSPHKETHRERFERERNSRNFLFATGHKDSLRLSAKDRRFATIGNDVLVLRSHEEGKRLLQEAFTSRPEHTAQTADAAEAMLAAFTSTMGVRPSMIGMNCRCSMPGAFILDDTYSEMLAKARAEQKFIANHSLGNTRMNETLRKRLTSYLDDSMNKIHVDIVQQAPISAADDDLGPGITRISRSPHTMSEPYGKAEPSLTDNREAPVHPVFEYDDEPAEDLNYSLPNPEPTFDHKLTTRKAQDTHVESENTEDLRQYRYTPDVD